MVIKSLKFLKRPHWLFAIVATIFGVFFISFTPPLWGVDEPLHFARAYGLSQGEIWTTKLPNANYGGNVPGEYQQVAGLVDSDVSKIRYSDPFFLRNDVPDKSAIYKAASTPLNTGKNAITPYPNTAIYSPFAYTGSVLGLWTAELFNVSFGSAVVFARIGTLLIYILLVVLALRLLADSRVKWLILAIALLPMCVFQASMINVDSLLIGESILLIALYIRVWKGDVTSKHLIAIGVLAVLLPLTKLNYVILLAPILFLPHAIWKKKRSEWLYKTCLIISGIIIALAWIYSVRGAADALSLSQGSGAVQPVAQLKSIIINPLNFVKALYYSVIVNDTFWVNGIFGQFAWDVLFLPTSMVVLLSAILLLAVFYDGPQGERRLNRRRGLVLILTALSAVMGVIVTLYMTWTPYHAAFVQGVQGRYFLPIIPFFLYGLRLLLPIHIRMSQRSIFVSVFAVAVFSLMFTMVYYHAVL